MMQLWVQIPVALGTGVTNSITWRPATEAEIRAAFFGLEEPTPPGSDVPLPTQGPTDTTGGGA